VSIAVKKVMSRIECSESALDKGKFGFDPMSCVFAKDPYKHYAVLRGMRELYYFEDFNMFLAARFRDVAEIGKTKTMVRSMDGLFSPEVINAQLRRENRHDMPFHSRFIQKNLLDSDGESHDRIRKQVFRLFTPAAIEQLRSSIQAFVDNLFDGLNADRFDFIEDFAAKIPGSIIGRLLGVPEEDCARLRAWSENIVQYFDLDRTAERKKIAEDTTRVLYEYLNSLKLQRRMSRRDDLISQLLDVEEADLMCEDEFMSTCMLILMAGHGSTLDVLGTGLYNLLRFPEQMARLRTNPTLINSAVQEMFRFESPLPFFHRYAGQNVVINGQEFAAGTKFGLMYGSANRDPDAFERPDKFDVARAPNRHLAFGIGPHFCLGNHLARLTMDITFSTLLRRCSNIELLDNEPTYKRGLSVRGVKTLNIAVAFG
jgi:hypothetical protein